MAIPVISKEYITNLLNEWYQEIRSQHINKAQQLKQEVEMKIANMEEDQNVLLYYSLLDFRHSILANSLMNADPSIQNIDHEDSAMDDFLAFYYHLFKGIYLTNKGNYLEARTHYQKAERLLDKVPDEAEKAEFYYRVGTFYYHIQQPLESIRYITNARYFYFEHFGYERNIASCDNIMGLCCILLKQYEEAEKHFMTSLKQLIKLKEKSLILKVRHNLGLLYAEQGFSSLAIQYLSDSLTNHNSKTMFLLAREHYKLGNHEEASTIISETLPYSDEEYTHHVSILQSLNAVSSIEQLESVVRSALAYFQKEGLWKYVEEYADMLALQFYNAKHYEKASEYFYYSNEAKNKSYKEILL